MWISVFDILSKVPCFSINIVREAFVVGRFRCGIHSRCDPHMPLSLRRCLKRGLHCEEVCDKWAIMWSASIAKATVNILVSPMAK